jgi:CBS domain-containing protein
MADPGARSALPRQKIKIGRHRADLARKPVEALSTLGGADGERGCVLRRGSFDTLRTLARDEVTSLRHKDVVAELGRFEGARNQAHHPARLLSRSAGRRVGSGRAAVPLDRKPPGLDRSGCENVKAADVMVRDVVTVHPDTDVSEAVKLMAARPQPLSGQYGRRGDRRVAVKIPR